MKDSTLKGGCGVLLFTMVTGGGGAAHELTEFYGCAERAEGQVCIPAPNDAHHPFHVEFGTTSAPYSTLPPLIDGWTTFPAAAMVVKELPHAEETIPLRITWRPHQQKPGAAGG